MITVLKYILPRRLVTDHLAGSNEKNITCMCYYLRTAVISLQIDNNRKKRL